ncbi:MAG: AMP-binding protein [Rhodocyclaceae bacterium]|nr:AMP-binding protein [Rhodocyclaceae bacterium]
MGGEGPAAAAAPVIGVGVKETGVTDWDALLARASRRFQCVVTAADDPALIIYTSGTTGNPKGALMAQRTCSATCPAFPVRTTSFRNRATCSGRRPTGRWTGGLFDALLPTWNYGMPILGSPRPLRPGEGLLADREVRRKERLPLSHRAEDDDEGGAGAEGALRCQPPHHHERRRGGGRNGLQLGARQLGVTINESSARPRSTMSSAAAPRDLSRLSRAPWGPYPGHRVAVKNDAGNVLPPGEVGEVCVQRACNGEMDPVFLLEYWKNPQATAEKFIGGDANEGGQAWGRTGDLAKWTGTATLWYQGRADDMFKSAGYRIGPSEIESCLVKHPAVANAAVIGAPDETRGTLVKAFIVAAAGAAGLGRTGSRVAGPCAPVPRPI